jgi:hypothetical protein
MEKIRAKQRMLCVFNMGKLFLAESENIVDIIMIYGLVRTRVHKQNTVYL